MGESRLRALWARRVVDEGRPPRVVDTSGGRIHVRWDEGAADTVKAGKFVVVVKSLTGSVAFLHQPANRQANRVRPLASSGERWGQIRETLRKR